MNGFTDWETFIAANSDKIFRMWYKVDNDEYPCNFVKVRWSITMPDKSVKLGLQFFEQTEVNHRIVPIFYDKSEKSYIEVVDFDEIKLAFSENDQNGIENIEL